jgi:hypothetical protein
LLGSARPKAKILKDFFKHADYPAPSLDTTGLNCYDPYTYYRADYNMTSQLVVTYDLVDSVGASAHDGMSLTGQDSYTCQALSGTRDNDAHNWFTRPKDSQCQVPDQGQLLVKPIQQIQNSLAAPLNDVALRAGQLYYLLSQQATDPDVKKERLITFVLTAGPAGDAAKSQLLALDKDLKFEVK